jgi:hypothetical protein
MDTNAIILQSRTRHGLQDPGFVQRRPTLTPPLAIMTRSMSSPCARYEEWILAALLRPSAVWSTMLLAGMQCRRQRCSDARDRTRKPRRWQRARGEVLV